MVNKWRGDVILSKRLIVSFSALSTPPSPREDTLEGDVVMGDPEKRSSRRRVSPSPRSATAVSWRGIQTQGSGLGATGSTAGREGSCASVSCRNRPCEAWPQLGTVGRRRGRRGMPTTSCSPLRARKGWFGFAWSLGPSPAWFQAWYCLYRLLRPRSKARSTSIFQKGWRKGVVRTASTARGGFQERNKRTEGWGGVGEPSCEGGGLAGVTMREVGAWS